MAFFDRMQLSLGEVESLLERVVSAILGPKKGPRMALNSSFLGFFEINYFRSFLGWSHEFC